jgi:hypothetical protein
MRGYKDLDFFRRLSFRESLEYYALLRRDLANEITVEVLADVIKGLAGGRAGSAPAAGPVAVGRVHEETNTAADAFFDRYF